MPGGVATVGSISVSIRSRASASRTCSRFHSRYGPLAQCCNEHPPQSPYWGETGAIRSGLAETISMSSARPSITRARTVSPGKVRPANTGPAGVCATPSPWPPTRSMLKVSIAGF